jgi:hypothetical protein
MAEQDQSQLRLDSMKSVYPEYGVILTDFTAMLAGLLPDGKIDIYDTFMDQEGYTWDAKTNSYVPKQGETDVRMVQWLF